MEALTFIRFGSYIVIVIRENALEFAYSFAIADGETRCWALIRYLMFGEGTYKDLITSETSLPE